MKFCCVYRTPKTIPTLKKVQSVNHVNFTRSIVKIGATAVSFAFDLYKTVKNAST